jgi:hypothetical protein
MGLFPASILASYVTDHVGVEHVRSFAVRHHRQVWLGDVIGVPVIPRRTYTECGV